MTTKRWIDEYLAWNASTEVRHLQSRWERQKKLALMVLDEKKSLEEIAKATGKKRASLASDICFGALVMREEREDAMKLYELTREPGIGHITAIKRFLESTS
jgi:hypothetical protein